jgi:glycosyltransferase involved in cell wall biosynthesis
MPRISVVIPAFNASAHLREALASVFTQTLLPSEVVVVDDGSTDATADIAAAFDPSVQVIVLRHGGVARARNAGLRAVTGDYVAWLDPDDVWAADKLSLQSTILLCDPALAGCYGAYRPFVSPELALAPTAQLACPATAQRGIIPATALIKRRAFAEVGPFDESLPAMELVDWLGRARRYGLRFEAHADVVAERRLHGGEQEKAVAKRRATGTVATRSSLLRLHQS